MNASQVIVTKSVTDTKCWVRRQERGIVEASIAVPSTARFKQTIENFSFAVIQEISSCHRQEVK